MLECGVGVVRSAVATSGIAERGEHIWRLDEAKADELLSFTEVCPSITWAEAFATAGFAMGDGKIWRCASDCSELIRQATVLESGK